MTFGENLSIIRKSRGYSQRKLAEMLNVSQGAVGMWESGQREPSFETLELLADFFNLPMSALIPSDRDASEDLVRRVADTINGNPKLGELFDKIRLLGDNDLDVIIAMVNSLTRNMDQQ